MDEQKIKMVVSYFNAIAGTRCAPDREQNIKWGSRILEVEEDAMVIRQEMKKWISEDDANRAKGFVGFAKHFIYELEREPKAQEPQPQVEVPQKPVTIESSADFLGKVVVELLAKTKAEEIKEAVIENAMNEV